MSSAFRATIELQVSCEFPSEAALGEGSFYLAALSVESVTLAAGVADTRRQEGRASFKAPVVLGRFWEESLEWGYSFGAKGSTEVTLSGRFAFEFDDPADLENYTIDDEPVKAIQIAWAMTGDSPKVYARVLSCSGWLADVEDDEDFEQL